MYGSRLRSWLAVAVSAFVRVWDGRKRTGMRRGMMALVRILDEGRGALRREMARIVGGVAEAEFAEVRGWVIGEKSAAQQRNIFFIAGLQTI